MNDPPVPAVSDPVDATRMTFGEHLEELRTRLIRSLKATFAALVLTMIFAEDLLRIVTAPYRRVMLDLHLDPSLKALGPTQPVVTLFKVSLMAAVAVAAPIWIYQLWAFVAAGLYEHEKKPVKRYFPWSVALFAGGVLFGYFALLPTGLRYLVTFVPPELVQNWTGISEYLSLFFTLTVLLGATFELPVVMLGLAKSGMVGSETFRAKRKFVIIGIFIVAGILTPPDPITQPLVAVPLCLLYELGILLAAAIEGKKRGPFAWGKLWRVVRVLLAIAVLGYVFRDRIARTWRGARADAKTETKDVQTGVPWRSVGRPLLGATPDSAFRLVESDGATTVAMASGANVALVRFSASDEQAVAAPVDEDSFEVLAVQAGAVLWRAELARDIPAAEALPPLLDALESGADETRAAVRRILAAALGRALPDDDVAAAEVVRAWLAAEPGRVFPTVLRRGGASRPTTRPEAEK
jgi:Tat protein translocase TatC